MAARNQRTSGSVSLVRRIASCLPASMRSLSEFIPSLQEIVCFLILSFFNGLFSSLDVRSIAMIAIQPLLERLFNPRRVLSNMGSLVRATDPYQHSCLSSSLWNGELAFLFASCCFPKAGGVVFAGRQDILVVRRETGRQHRPPLGNSNWQRETPIRRSTRNL